MARRGTDHTHADPFACGEYVVDERAVAQAILDRIAGADLPRSAMLESGQPVDRRSRGVGEDGPAAGAGRS